MSKINSRVAAIAIVILSLGFAATGAAPASAHVEQARFSPRATAHRAVDYRLAGRAPASPSALSCDLPSSGCSDNERITN